MRKLDTGIICTVQKEKSATYRPDSSCVTSVTLDQIQIIMYDCNHAEYVLFFFFGALNKCEEFQHLSTYNNIIDFFIFFFTKARLS